MIRELQAKIQQLKLMKDAVVLAHSYVAKEITEIADFVGDSYMLSVKAKQATARNLVVCGVHFMAETAKILNPEKIVYLAHKGAGCPMAEQFTAEQIAAMKEEDPERKIVSYINTTAAIKELSDICVTSATALKVVNKLEADKILFIPDCNLGAYVSNNVKNKDIKLVDGGCPIHAAVTLDDLNAAKEAHPNAMVLVHPECRPEVVAASDYVGSTTGIINYAKYSDHSDFIIGTENSIVELLQYECPSKNFYVLSKHLLCPDMKLTTLMDVYNTLEGIGVENSASFEIEMTAQQIENSRKCIDEMLRLSE